MKTSILMQKEIYKENNLKVKNIFLKTSKLTISVIVAEVIQTNPPTEDN